VLRDDTAIYMKRDVNSQILRVLEKGTLLGLFSDQTDWVYVYYKSEKTGAILSGYVLASTVEIIQIAEVKEEEPKEKEPIIKEKKVEPEKKEAQKEEVEKIEVKKEEPPKQVEPPEQVEPPKIEEPIEEEYFLEDTKKDTKVYVRFSFSAGFAEGSQSLSWSREIYFENATYNNAYNFGKGNSLDFGVGYKFSRSLGVELGFDTSSRNIGSEYSAGIPHPLLFAESRNASNSDNYKLKENLIYLNLVLSIPFNKFSFDLTGGPAYFLTSAELINAVQFSEEAYPYDSISVNATTEKLSKNSMGFNAGASLNFYVSRGFGVYIVGQYFYSSVDYGLGEEIPGVTVKLGGLKTGVGIKILF